MVVQFVTIQTVHVSLVIVVKKSKKNKVKIDFISKNKKFSTKDLKFIYLVKIFVCNGIAKNEKS